MNLKTKLVTAYWMDSEGYPYQGARQDRKIRYLGSLISHCIGNKMPVICYTHKKNLEELMLLKNNYNLYNLEIKLLELNQIKYHDKINEIREKNFYTENSNFGLDGRGPEIMWGKFDVLERESVDCDIAYWIDVGLQHPGIFPWRYCKKYNKLEDHRNLLAAWWADLDVFNFSSILNHNIYDKLNSICYEKKIVLITATSPQISYPIKNNSNIISPYPIGGLIGGNTTILQKYINYYWEFAKNILDENILCTEEVIMKLAFDQMNKNNLFTLSFDRYHGGEHDVFHFEMWDKFSGVPKPLYMIWHDILNY